MPSAGFETAIPVIERTQTTILTATRISPPFSLFTILQTFDQTYAVETLLLNKLRKM